MFEQYSDISKELNQRVYDYPAPEKIADALDDKEVQEYIRNCYQRHLVLDVLGNLKINNNFSKAQISSLESNIGSPEGITLLVDHILHCLADAKPN
jgi:hypothetical protein